MLLDYDFNMLNLETEKQMKSSIKYNPNIRNISEDYLKSLEKPFMVGYIKKIGKEVAQFEVE